MGFVQAIGRFPIGKHGFYCPRNAENRCGESSILKCEISAKLPEHERTGNGYHGFPRAGRQEAASLCHSLRQTKARPGRSCRRRCWYRDPVCGIETALVSYKDFDKKDSFPYSIRRLSCTFEIEVELYDKEMFGLPIPNLSK